MWKAGCDHILPSLVSFHSLHVLLLLATQWLVRALVKLLGGSPFNFTPLHSLNGPVGQLLASRLGIQRFRSRRCTHSHNGIRLLSLPLSRYNYIDIYMFFPITTFLFYILKSIFSFIHMCWWYAIFYFFSTSCPRMFSIVWSRKCLYLCVLWYTVHPAILWQKLVESPRCSRLKDTWKNLFCHRKL